MIDIWVIATNDEKSREQRGSLTIEALLVMTMLLLILFTTIGFAYAEHIEVEMMAEMQATSSDMSVFMLVPLNTSEYPQKVVVTNLLNIWSQSQLQDAFKGDHLITKINTSQSYLDNEEIYMWHVTYEVALPLLSLKKTAVLPVASVYDKRINQTNDLTLYITRTGECYHLETCYHLRQSKIKTTKSEAIENGYRPCKVCLPNGPEM